MPTITEDNQQQLAALLQAKYPQRENLRIQNVQEITGGWETQIYSFSLHYEENDEAQRDDLILRFYQGARQQEQARKEYRVMGRAAQAGIPVPAMELLVDIEFPFGNPFIVMEKIAGPTLDTLLQHASEKEMRRLMKLMVTHLVQLHQLAWQQVFPPDSQSAQDALSYVTLKLSEMRATADQFNLTAFEPCLHWLESRTDQVAATRLCIMHNDYHPLNILLRPNNDSIAIIDWSFAEVGDYRLDLAWSVLLFGVMLGERYRQDMLTLYEDIAGSKVEHFEFFEALKFTQRMLTIATWLDDSVEIPVKKITKEAIHGDYKVHVLNPYRRLIEITGLTIPLIENL